MKKVSFNSRNRFNLLVSAAAIVFLLQGCCVIPDFYISKKPCNCKDDNKPVYAVNHNKQVAFRTAFTGSMEQSIHKSYLVSGMEDAVNLEANISADPMIESLQAGETVQPISYTYTNAPEQESKGDDLLLPGPIKHRNTSEKKLPFGIKGVSTSIIAAPNISFKSSKEDYGNIDHKHKPGIGFQFGIGTAYTFTDKFAVSTSLLFKKNNASEELNYSSIGEPGSSPIGESESKYSYSNLSVPILAKVKLTDRLTAMAGPEINYLLNASVKSTGNGNSEKTSITDNSVKVRAGVQLGIRYDFPGSPLALQLIYDHQLSRLNKKYESDYYYPGGGSSETPAWHMKSIGFGLIWELCELLKKE